MRGIVFGMGNFAALSHLRVLDLSRVLAGPWATQILGDLGAEVIKIERPVAGDETRGWGPPFFSGAGLSAYYACTNRNKKSVAVDIAQPAGAEIVRGLALQSDVLVENFKVGGLKQYGLDYESLKSDHPRLIYCSITGFGQTGPEAERAGYDAIVQAMGGLMSVTGRPDGEPGGGPVKTGVALTDILTGLYATVAILAAVEHRVRSGQGQHIDVALLDVQVACLANQAASFLATGKSPARLGSAHPSIVPYQDFPTADGAMMLAVGNDAQFAAFCRVAGHPEWAADPRFATNSARVENRPTLIPMIQEVTAARGTRQWREQLAEAGVPCGPINTVAEVFHEPQVLSRGLRVEMSGEGTVPMVASPLRLSDSPVTYRLQPPRLGADTSAVLAAVLGLGEEDIEALRHQGVICGAA
jgi:crotonobetainyl-CoA:carnitine CoA-transferase CaiB-like acyl-CoA transferase